MNEMSPINKIDISFSKEPGVYEILDVQNDCSYYGETNYFFNRVQLFFQRKKKKLRNGTHPCPWLLEAFQQQNDEAGFQFFVLVSGQKWRRQKNIENFKILFFSTGHGGKKEKKKDPLCGKENATEFLRQRKFNRT